MRFNRIYSVRYCRHCHRKLNFIHRRKLVIETATAWKVGSLIGSVAAGAALLWGYQRRTYYAPENYDAVREALKEILVQPDYVDGHIGPLLIRLVFNSCSTFDIGDGSGGINGSTMRFEAENQCKFNKGLAIAFAYLEPIKAEFPWISYADLWVLASYVALEEMGGPHLEFRPGRIDLLEAPTFVAKDRVFKTDWGPTGMRKVFHRMGLNDREIVCLMNGHTLGRAHQEYTGYCGHWTTSPFEFDNQYSKELFNNDWCLDRTFGTKQFIDITRTRMMLSVDYCMTVDATFRKWLEHYAEKPEKLRRDFGICFKKCTELGVFPQDEIRGLPPHDDEASSEETLGWLVELEKQEQEQARLSERNRLARLDELERKYGASSETSS